MPEIADLPGCEGTFVGTELEIRRSETIEDLAEAVELLPPGSGKDDDEVSQRRPVRMRSMSLEKVAGALQRPKGTWLSSSNLPLLVQKAVFSLSRSWIGTCQYSLLRSRV